MKVVREHHAAEVGDAHVAAAVVVVAAALRAIDDAVQHRVDVFAPELAAQRERRRRPACGRMPPSRIRTADRPPPARGAPARAADRSSSPGRTRTSSRRPSAATPARSNVGPRRRRLVLRVGLRPRVRDRVRLGRTVPLHHPGAREQQRDDGCARGGPPPPDGADAQLLLHGLLQAHLGAVRQPPPAAREHQPAVGVQPVAADHAARARRRITRPPTIRRPTAPVRTLVATGRRRRRRPRPPTTPPRFFCMAAAAFACGPRAAASTPAAPRARRPS